MAPRQDFTGIIKLVPVTRPRAGYHELLDFAWRYFERPLTMEKDPETITRLDTLYFRSLWRRQFDSVTGFSSGMPSWTTG